MQEEWDVYEAASGAQRRCTASPALVKTRGNLLQFRFSEIVYALYLRRKEDGVTIDKVEKRLRVHPYVAKMTIKYIGDKLKNSSASDRQSLYHLRFETDDGFAVMMGLTRLGNEDPEVTHLWVKCSAELLLDHRRRLQRLLANIGAISDRMMGSLWRHPQTLSRALR